jgi:hypothetical protein
MLHLPPKHVHRCYGVERIDLIAAVGTSGGGLAKTFGDVGIQYLQVGELDRLRAEGVKEISLDEMDALYRQELQHLKDDNKQLSRDVRARKPLLRL